MRAMVLKRYGSPVKNYQLTELPIPTPGDNEVLVKVHNAGINALDWRIARADPFFIRFSFGLFKPKNVMGGKEISGTVQRVGKNVTRFQTGDHVIGGLEKLSGFAEYVCTPENCLSLKPDNVSFAEATMLPLAGQTALIAVRDSITVSPGEKVLLTGASGGCGVFCLQLLKLYGAEVTAVCSSSKMEAVKELGADRVIDYNTTDFTTEGIQYDYIVDAACFTPFSRIVKAMKPDATHVLVGGSASLLFRTMIFGSMYKKKNMKLVTVDWDKTEPERLKYLANLVAEGKLQVPIDRSFKLTEVGSAIKCLEDRTIIGKVAIEVME